MITLFFSPTTLLMTHIQKQAPPLSIAYLAQFLQLKGFECYSINPNNFVFDISMYKKEVEKYVLSKSIKEIEKTSPKYLVISTWTYGMPFTIELISKFKERNPDVVVILGGRNATFLPEETLKITKADYIVQGEGQYVLWDLIVNLESGKMENNSKINNKNNLIKNIDIKKRIIKNDKQIDLNQLPLLDFSSFDMKGIDQFYLMSSLGCYHNCKFCSDTALWTKFRSYSVDYMKKQVELLQKLYGDIFITFWDSNFTMNPDFGRKFAKSVDLRWACYSRIDNVSKSILKDLKGLRWMYFGIESLNPETLLYFNKTKDPKQYIKSTWKSLELLDQFGIKAACSYILGSPNETKESLLRNKEHICNLKKKAETEISMLTLELNSPLWLEYKQNKIEVFKTKLNETLGYAGVQPFSEKYDDITLTPQKYLIENQHLDNEEFEKILSKLF